MGERRSYSEVEAERAKYPLGKPGAYKPGHKNYLAPDYLPRRPNRIPLGERVINILLSLFLLGYGSYGLSIDDLHIPGKRTEGLHLHGLAATSMFVAMCFAIANLLAVVIDHYDTRDNEVSYRNFAIANKYAAISFFAGALVLHIMPV